MNWSTQLGIKILFWIADVLIGDAFGAGKRAELKALATSFSVDAKHAPAETRTAA